MDSAPNAYIAWQEKLIIAQIGKSQACIGSLNAEINTSQVEKQQPPKPEKVKGN